MEFCNESVIENLYNSDMLTDIESTEEYKRLISKFNKLYDTIEDEELKEKFVKLLELKNAMHIEDNRQIFKIGYSLSTKTLIEALVCKM